MARDESFGSFPWKKLGGALRNTEAKEKLTLFLRRLRRHFSAVTVILNAVKNLVACSK